MAIHLAFILFEIEEMVHVIVRLLSQSFREFNHLHVVITFRFSTPLSTFLLASKTHFEFANPICNSIESLAHKIGMSTRDTENVFNYYKYDECCCCSRLQIKSKEQSTRYAIELHEKKKTNERNDGFPFYTFMIR